MQKARWKHSASVIFFNCTEDEVIEMYQQENLPTDILLKWSKLLEYDFFRIYSQHLILYAPIKSENTNREKSLLPQFRKNIYTREIIDFILERIRTNEMSKNEVIERYRIPKTTLYKRYKLWLESPLKKSFILSGSMKFPEVTNIGFSP